jgi:archaellum biogenesis ATPase FlaH
MNEPMIRKWYDIFKHNHELVEIRIVDNNKKGTYSGYFTDIDTLLNAIRRYDDCNIYFTLNSILDSCYSREQRDRIVTRPKSTTSDAEIIGRDWCLIDIDCEKPSDTNSTDEEKEAAKAVVNDVFKFLRDEGFTKPIVCDSANGFHLLINMNMANTPENTQTMKDFLQVLDMLFSTEKVKVDTSTFNASRICKLYGCYSRKGSDTPERPQRESKILKIPDEIKPTPNEFFEKVAAMLPKPEQPNRANNYQPTQFDLQEFLTKYGIKVRNIVKTTSFTKYVLEECPFNSSHRAPDSAIFEMAGGGFGFKCLHSSCSGYTWKDFRLHFDPNAYTKSDYVEYQSKAHRPYFHNREKEEFVPIGETEDKGKKWLAMKDIQYVDMNNIPRMPTGYRVLDKNIGGLLFGEVTLVSGSNSSGKSSWLNNLSLNIINYGYKVAIWSGELVASRLKGWINQLAAGKNYVQKVQGYDEFYYAPKHISDRIDSWTDGKLFLYNNKYGTRWKQLMSDITNLIESEGANLVVIDNLMTLNLEDYEGDNNKKQSQFILAICDFAKKYNVHIILVAHPRKQTDFLRKESISGSADLTNAVDNCFIIHRVNKDFETRGKDFFGTVRIAEMLQYGNVLEVCKNRSFGKVDLLCGMYYEIETRRFKNDIAENINYNWQEEPKPVPLIQNREPERDYMSDYQQYYYDDDNVFKERDYCPF